MRPRRAWLSLTTFPMPDNKTKLSEIIAQPFFPVHAAIRAHAYTHYWLSGGRGSTKSSFVSLEIINLILRNPGVNAMVLRKVGATVGTSVWAQMLWAVETMGLGEQFAARSSPYSLTYKPTGQKILFRGLDDKLKLKSIKLPRGYFGIIWYEELDQFSGDDELRSVNQSLMRGGDKYWAFYTYNPPKSRDSWVNVSVMDDRPDRLTHGSTYLGVPPAWLGEQFIREAEFLRDTRPMQYAHEYLGEATGTGGAVFDNAVDTPLSDADIAALGVAYEGIDFGFAVDPFCWLRMAYRPARRELFIYDEIYEPRLTLRAFDEQLRAKRWPHEIITADSEDPRSIAELRDMGHAMRETKKGPDSVRHSIKWLQDLAAIHIDRRRCPNAWREFSLYEYEQNKDGQFISAYPDKNNHAIDATRYAMENVIRAKKIQT